MAERSKLFSEELAQKQGVDQDQEPDFGPCASVARGKWVTALKVRRVNEPSRYYLYKDLATVAAEVEPTRFVVFFEGREERYLIVVTGRNLEGLCDCIVQGRIEWIQAVPQDRDFAEDGQMVITKIEVVKEPVK